jgi:tetratricopeptide (TPR) repeat protein
VGLALLGGVVITALFAAGRHLRRFADPERITMSALVAALVAYAVAVGIDWMWELTVVSVVGIALLSLAAGPATAPRQRQAEPTLWIRTNPRVRVAGGIGILLAAWLVICAQAIPLLTEFKLSDSEAAVRRGDAEEALLAADAARALQPWAASPYLQLALVHEHAGELERARAAIRDAIRRHPRDWRLWLVAARVETKLGSIPEARRSLDQAATLNPKSPLFGGIGADG